MLPFNLAAVIINQRNTFILDNESWIVINTPESFSNQNWEEGVYISGAGIALISLLQAIIFVQRAPD